MIWLNVLLALISVPFLVIGCVYSADGKNWGGIVAFLSAVIMSVNISIIIAKRESEIPTALDVYRGKTTLEITYRDSMAIDSVVVYKMK